MATDSNKVWCTPQHAGVECRVGVANGIHVAVRALVVDLQAVGPLVMAPHVGHHLEAVATREEAHVGVHPATTLVHLLMNAHSVKSASKRGTRLLNVGTGLMKTMCLIRDSLRLPPPALIHMVWILTGI
jgi:hypothetical protein